MKILLDGRLYGLENAGIGRYITNLVEKLAEIDRQNEYVIFLRKKYFEDLELPSNWKKVLADFRHYSFREQIELPWLIHKENPNLVHFPHFNVPIFYTGNYVVTVHDTLMHQQKGIDATTLPAPAYLIKRLAYHLVFKIAVFRSKAIIVPSQAIKNDLIREYKISEKKVTVTYEGVDEKIQTVARQNNSGAYFVYAGNAYPHKNLKRLIQATLSLNRNYTQRVNLLIASSRNVFTQRVDKLINGLGASGFVKILGFVPDKELGYLFRGSKGFVFPSLSEGFGLPGLEAMSVGTLLLASDIPVFKEIYGERALYFNPLDFSSIEKTMLKVLNLPLGERKKLIELGQKFVKRYSWVKMAKETLAIYRTNVRIGS